MSEYMIETKNIHKSFPIGNKETLEVLKGIDIVVPKGKLTILKGRSGSGKTTLLNILSMLDDATEGTFLIDDEDVSKMDSSQKEIFRRYNIGFVFQSVALVPIMSAYENVDFGLKLAEYDGDKDARINAAKINDYLEILKTCGKAAGEPFVKPICDDIWELRPIRNRILFAAWTGEVFVLLHCFVKKSRKTPQSEIKRAKREFEDFKRRNGDG